MMRVKLLCQRRLFRATGYSNHSKAHSSRELNAQMSQAADALDHHKVSGTGRRVSKRVVGGQAGTEKWRGVRRTQLIWDSSQPALAGDHDFSVATVVVYSGEWLALAVDEISPSTRLALAAMTAKETHTNPLANFPIKNSFADGIDLTDRFMTRNTRIDHAGKNSAFHGRRVAMADAACFDPDPDLPRRRVCHGALNEFEFSGFGDLNGAIGQC